MRREALKLRPSAVPPLHLPAALFLALLSMLCATGDAAAAPMRASADARDFRFAGQVNIGGGRSLYMECEGTGRPVVILESGIHDSSDVWSVTDVEPPVASSPSVFEGVSQFTRVCRYDRPGTIRYTDPPRLTARSTPVFAPRTLQGMVNDLRAMLTSARVPGPYLLVAHSYGGMIARLFAQQHPSESAGVVLVDAFSPELKSLLSPADWKTYVVLLNHPGTALDGRRGFETSDVDGAMEALAKAPPLPEVPLAILSKTEPFAIAAGVSKRIITEVEQAWPKAQTALVRLEPQTPHILATGSDHYIQVHDPDITISAIRLIFDRVVAGKSQRTKSPNR